MQGGSKEEKEKGKREKITDKNPQFGEAQTSGNPKTYKFSNYLWNKQRHQPMTIKGLLLIKLNQRKKLVTSTRQLLVLFISIN